MYKLFLLAIIVFSLVSCGVPKEFQHSNYFQDSVTAVMKKVIDSPTIIQPGDRLNINITATNKAEATAFNNEAATGTQGYLVDSLGNIQLLQLGTIQVAGLSTARLTDSLESRLADYLKGVIVTANIINFKIKVFGEVGSPGILEVPDGKITILDAIIRSGDLGLYAHRQNILIIREENGTRTFGRIDITSNSLFQSPYYYLKQNDVVYVEADNLKYINNDPRLDKSLRNLGIATTVLSFVLLIVNLVK